MLSLKSKWIVSLECLFLISKATQIIESREVDVVCRTGFGDTASAVSFDSRGRRNLDILED